MRMYYCPSIRTGANYFPYTEYEIGAMRIGEALHCIIGCWYSPEFDPHHVIDELRLINRLIEEYGGEHDWGNYHITNWNRYDAETQQESISSMQHASLRNLRDVERMRSEVHLPGIQQEIAIAVYDTLEALALAILRSIEDYPDELDNAYRDVDFLNSVTQLRNVVRDWLMTKTEVRSPLWPAKWHR